MQLALLYTLGVGFRTMKTDIWTRYIFSTTKYIERLVRIGYGFTLIGHDLINTYDDRLVTEICLTLIITKDDKCIGIDDAHQWIRDSIKTGADTNILRNNNHCIHRTRIRGMNVQLYIPTSSQSITKKIKIQGFWSSHTLCPRESNPRDYPNYTFYARFLKDRYIQRVQFGNFQFYSGEIKRKELFHIEGRILTPSYVGDDEDYDVCTVYIVVFDRHTFI